MASKLCLKKYRDRHGIWRVCHKPAGHKLKCK